VIFEQIKVVKQIWDPFCHLVSISPTFYEWLLQHQNPLTKKLQTQIVSTQKLRKKLLYEKAARKILVKLTPGSRNWQLISPHSLNRAPIHQVAADAKNFAAQLQW
jgi:hypothetical protein